MTVLFLVFLSGALVGGAIGYVLTAVLAMVSTAAALRRAHR